MGLRRFIDVLSWNRCYQNCWQPTVVCPSSYRGRHKLTDLIFENYNHKHTHTPHPSPDAWQTVLTVVNAGRVLRKTHKMSKVCSRVSIKVKNQALE